MSAAQAGNPDEPTVLVLVVEDERSIAGFVAEVVEEAGYTPVVATNGHEALEKARERWPALVVTDLMMPHLDGAGLIQALKKEATAGQRAVPPIILMTAASTAYAGRVDADALLRKPFNLDELEELLHRFLD